MLLGRADETDTAPSWRFWLLWVIATSVGWLIGGSVGTAADASLGRTLAVYTSIGGGGMLAALPQWLLLRGRMTRAGSWVLASAVAVATISLLTYSWDRLDSNADSAVGVILFGAVLGLTQWFLVLRQFRASLVWIAISAAAWIAGGLAADPTGWIGLGAVYGGITGAYILRLFKQQTEPVGPTLRP